MSDDNTDYYLERIAELESEVSDREKDLSKFRQELTKANGRLESLISQLRHDIKLAQTVQKSLVPTEFPNIPGFEFSTKFVPSMIAGGDYFDIFEHEDKFRFGIIIANSSGHTMSALFLSVLLKLTGRMESRRGSEPHQVVTDMIEELLENIKGDESADLFYALIDRRSYEMSYCRVGNVTALFQDFATGELTNLRGSENSIGIGFNDKLSTEVKVLNPRDRIILCTRGITDAQNIDGEFFGQDRLYRAILEGPKQGVHETRNEILYQTNKFMGGTEPKRDMTFMVSEVKDRVIKLAKK